MPQKPQMRVFCAEITIGTFDVIPFFPVKDRAIAEKIPGGPVIPCEKSLDGGGLGTRGRIAEGLAAGPDIPAIRRGGVTRRGL